MVCCIVCQFAYASIDWDWNKDQGPYESASAGINVWNVHVAPHEFSVSAVIIMNHDDYITVGWKVRLPESFMLYMYVIRILLSFVLYVIQLMSTYVTQDQFNRVTL